MGTHLPHPHNIREGEFSLEDNKEPSEGKVHVIWIVCFYKKQQFRIYIIPVLSEWRIHIHTHTHTQYTFTTNNSTVDTISQYDQISTHMLKDTCRLIQTVFMTHSFLKLNEHEINLNNDP